MSSDAIQVSVTKAKAVRVAWLWNWISLMNKRTFVHLLENLLKKFPLMSPESRRRERNTIRFKFSSYKCTVNNKSKVIIISAKLKRIHLSN